MSASAAVADDPLSGATDALADISKESDEADHAVAISRSPTGARGGAPAAARNSNIFIDQSFGIGYTIEKRNRRASFAGRKSSIMGSFAEGAADMIMLGMGVKQEAYTPLRLLQASPICHWLKENDDDLRNLAKFFTVHRFSAGDVIPQSPFYLIGTGLVNVHTNTGHHSPVTHGRGCFFISVNAQHEVSKPPKSTGFFGWLCGGASEEWEEYLDDDSDDEADAIHPVQAPPIAPPVHRVGALW